MTEFYSGNRFLNEEEMTVNAKYIYNHLSSKGWTINAIAAMLGNMETESTINPGIWQNLDEGNYELGYGLVQWTPATKFLNWCDTYNLDDQHLASALLRIEYELEREIQWISTDAYPMTFAEFSVSDLDPSYLAMAFLNNYERPADRDQPQRGDQAMKWFQILSENGEGSSGGSITIKKRKMPLWLKYIGSRR